MSKFNRILLTTLMEILLLSSCRAPAADPAATLTQVSADILATWAAGTPLVISLGGEDQESTPLPTPQPAWQAPTPQAVARVKSEILNLREGPATEYPSLEILSSNAQLLVLGQADICQWYKVLTPTGRKGWVSGGNYYVDVSVPCDLIPEASFQPMNGTLLVDYRAVHGSGKLTVSNTTRYDAIVILANLSNYTELAFYLQAGKQASVENVAENTYELFFELGTDWLNNSKQFSQSMGTFHSKEAFTVTSTQNEKSITLSTEANAASPVEKEQFPSIAD